MGFEGLPKELILHILAYVSYRELIAIHCTSKNLLELARSEALWRSLCLRRWRIWNENPHSIAARQNNQWKILYQQRHLKDRYFSTLLEQMSYASSPKERLEYETQIISYGREALELMRKIQLQGSKHENLTNKYFALKICFKFSQIECIERWRRHLLILEEERNLEDGAILIAQSFGHPRLDPKSIYQQLDLIAQGALSRIGTETKPEIRFSVYNSYFFKELGFRGLDYDSYSASNSHIHQVLQTRRGIQISLALVYCVIARRLQIPISMIGMPQHFLTRYEGEGPLKNHFIDVFGGGEIISELELQTRGFPLEFATPSSSLEVYTRLLRNFIEEFNSSGQAEKMLEALNQSIFISPQQEELAYRAVIHLSYTGDVEAAKADVDLLTSLGSITENGEMILRNKIRAVEEAQQQAQNLQTKIKTSSIKYCVGNIFRHNKFGYRGVIYGWHDSCPQEGQTLISSGQESVQNGPNQPFYNVLIDTRDKPAQTSCVAEENIQLESGDYVYHPDVGLYFTAFSAGNYVPNKRLRREYPTDLCSEWIPSNPLKRPASMMN